MMNHSMPNIGITFSECKVDAISEWPNVAVRGNYALVGDRHHLVRIYNIDPFEEIRMFDGLKSRRNQVPISISTKYAVAGASWNEANGVPSAGEAYLFDLSSNLIMTHTFHADDGAESDEFGSSVAIDGNNVLIGAPRDDDLGKDTGSAYLFDISNGKQLKKFVLPHEESEGNDYFGERVALHGKYAVIAPNEKSVKYGGRVFIYDITSNITKSTSYLWKLVGCEGKSAEGSDAFGYSVSISGDNVLVGAPGEKRVGAAYLFNASTGKQIHKFRANDSAKWDYFGTDASISGNYAVVSAPYHAGDSGSVYLFDISTGQQIKKYMAFDPTPKKYFGVSVAIDGGNLLVGSKGSVYFSGQCKK
ncbi:MAG: hypothetical protein GY696_23920 [Gammaproteobacteria bacterium]|nr:hypothetical protein [Gammaproteobacteria bacterium]